ncbi:hypothetical protein Tco_0492408, partial [Tanacetum coccineum]
MDNPDITMEEYIRLEEEKARRRGKTLTGKPLFMVRCGYDDHKISSEPTVSPLDDNRIDFDFVISYDESDDEDYTFTYDKNSFSYKLVSINDLKLNSDNYDNEIDVETPLVDVFTNSLDDDIDINVSAAS